MKTICRFVGAFAFLHGLFLAGQSQESFVVERTTFEKTVVGSGEAFSTQAVAVRSRVRRNSTILVLVPEGSFVRKGELLARLDTSAIEEAVSEAGLVLAQAEGEAVAAEEGLKLAELLLERDRRRLAIQRLEVELELRTVTSELESGASEALQSKLAIVKARLELVGIEEKVLVVSEIRALVLAREALARSQAALKMRRDELERVRAELEGCVIKSPRDGVVTYAGGLRQEPVDVGSEVREGQSLMTVAPPHCDAAWLFVDERDVSSLALGQEVLLRVPGAEPVLGKLKAISSVPMPRWGNPEVRYRVEVALDDRAGLGAGRAVEGSIRVDSRKDVLTVPATAVVSHEGKFHCRLVTGQGIVSKEVKVGPGDEHWTVVLEGLREGDRVLVTGR